MRARMNCKDVGAALVLGMHPCDGSVEGRDHLLAAPGGGIEGGDEDDAQRGSLTW